jgi:preprotein translocase subunit SecD
MLTLALLLAQAVFQPTFTWTTPRPPLDDFARTLVLRAELLGAKEPVAQVRADGSVLLATPSTRLDPARLLDQAELGFHAGGDALEHVHVVQAYLEEEPFTGNWNVVTRLDEPGTQAFARFTGDHVDQQVDMLVDGVLVTQPYIRSAVSSGRCLVAGNFDRRQAERVLAGLQPLSHARLVETTDRAF